MKIFFARTFAIALVLILSATGLWAAGAEEEAPAAAMEKEMVTDPTTGKTVEAPRYGGTFTQAMRIEPARTSDPWFTYGANVGGVIEKLGIGNWAIDRDEFSFSGFYIPVSILTGRLAESWEQTDPTTYVFKIRKGVHWHSKPPMNGRELTAYDIEWNYHRYTGMGDFTEAGPSPAVENVANLPWESITATDKWTVVFKLKELNLDALQIILDDQAWILPPEVIEQHGDLTDQRNLVGTGPFMLTDRVFGSSETYTKNPDYWGYDEKYPENRLPYVDEYRRLVIKEAGAVIAALRSGKIDVMGRGDGGELADYEVIASVMRTNPEIAWSPIGARNTMSIAPDVRKLPFDDVRVRHAMQMAMDNETINETYAKGWGSPKPQGMVGLGMKGMNNPFEEWPEEIKQYYRYDPEGAEALLDEAGYPRGADGIRFKTTWEYYYAMPLSYAEILVEYWREIGVEVEIFIQDRARHTSSIREHTFEGMVNAVNGWDFHLTWLLGAFHSERFSTVWGRSGAQDPVFDAMYDAVFAATTLEEQQGLVKEADMYIIEKHWYIWGVAMPQYGALQPWVKGHNHEIALSTLDFTPILARLWIDQELKEAMGY